VCGPTVYDFAHIGNARPIIVFDVLFRLLRHVYGADAVTYVRNITDVDDKINARAAEEGVPIAEITERTTAQFHADIAELGVLEPTVEPRATDHVAEMIEMISRLVDKGNAYAADGHVLFDVPSMADYGALSHRSLDEMEAGARVEVAPYKKAPTDFVLWKPSDADQPGWDSPWGRGRPGWHIECSAMSWKYLGETFDIHGGGVDLVFPHHENELAQSRCCWGTEVMANYWMHNGFLQVEGEKMSKSLGNFVTIHDLLETDGFGGRNWPGEVLRLAMLMTHYRQPIDWTEAGLKEAETILDGWYRQAAEQGDEEGEEGQGDATPPAAVLDALSDDLNTPAAIAELHKLRNKAARGDRKAARDLKAGAGLLGLLAETHHQWQARKEAESPLEPAEIEAMIAKRIAARKAKDWAEADRIRDELVAKGIVLMDGPEGTRWEVAR
jgi:cysteinyl-tRNA synthetase